MSMCSNGDDGCWINIANEESLLALRRYLFEDEKEGEIFGRKCFAICIYFVFVGLEERGFISNVDVWAFEIGKAEVVERGRERAHMRIEA